MSTDVTRRSVVTGAAVAALGGVLGFVYGRRSDAARVGARRRGGYGAGYGGLTAAAGTLLARLDTVPIGGAKIVTAGGGVVVVRTGAVDVRAYSAICTHLGCTVNRVSAGRIYCPCHGSVFAAASGAVVQGPATAPLAVVPVEVRDGGVYSA